jgi:aminopeptidase YwaD
MIRFIRAYKYSGHFTLDDAVGWRITLLLGVFFVEDGNIEIVPAPSRWDRIGAHSDQSISVFGWRVAFMPWVKSITLVFAAAILVGSVALAQEKPPLLPETAVQALAQELSGETAKRNLEFLARLHRQRGSRQFHQAAEFIAAQAKSYGLEDAHIEQFPADGKTMYGTQKGRMAWDADFAELWELRWEKGQWIPAARLADFDAMPVTLAEDSESADVTADLVDAGDGTAESDYAGKDVRGKLVLVAAQPGEVQRLAVDRFGAAGIISYAQNQPTAWSGEDENLIRWGHLISFSTTKTFGFMVSLKQGRELRRRLARGETIRFHAVVRAGQHPGSYDIVTATIPGADPALREKEIVFSCHLDHERPGANDNASGCVTILEVARALSKLITENKIPRPARTLRFIWPPEIEGTMVLLNGKPGMVSHMQAVIHMDMVGGGPVTKAVFHITRSPMSLPTFIDDVAEAFGDFVNRQTFDYAATGHAAYPLVAPEGGKEPLQAQFSEYTPGSDHDIYCEGSYRIPAIYFNDWPDRYIHTNFDSAANIDPTKLLRAAFLGAASGYFLANFSANDIPAVFKTIQSRSLLRVSSMLRRREQLSGYDAASLAHHETQYEQDMFQSISRFTLIPASAAGEAELYFKNLQPLGRMFVDSSGAGAATGNGALVFTRNPEPKGPASGLFGYDYFVDHYGAEKAAQIRLLKQESIYNRESYYPYEVLNFVDGKRTVQEIRDAVSAEYGPVPLDVVMEYLKALESIGILRFGP